MKPSRSAIRLDAIIDPGHGDPFQCLVEVEIVGVAEVDVDIAASVPTSQVNDGSTVAIETKDSPVKYVLLIHSNPQPWGHPTSDYVAEHQALPKEQQDALMSAFEAIMQELDERGELVGGEALADAASARLYRWQDGSPLPSDGPYSEAKEHLAGFFLIDVESRERAEEVAAVFAGPGETVELRPTMWPGGGDE